MKKNRMILYVFGILMIAISYLGNQYFSSKEGVDLFFNGGYQINSYVIASAVFVFAKYFWKESDEKKSVTALASYTFSIYCMHAIVLEKLMKITHASHIMELVLLSIPTMIISAIIAMIISKVKKMVKEVVPKKVMSKL